MTKRQEVKILDQIIEKSKKLGFDITFGLTSLEKVVEYKIFYKIIFNHEWQKHFWGIDLVNKNGETYKFERKSKIVINGDDLIHRWQFHAKEMAIADNYLEYISKFI